MPRGVGARQRGRLAGVAAARFGSVRRNASDSLQGRARRERLGGEGRLGRCLALARAAAVRRGGRGGELDALLRVGVLWEEALHRRGGRIRLVLRRAAGTSPRTHAVQLARRRPAEHMRRDGAAAARADATATPPNTGRARACSDSKKSAATRLRCELGRDGLGLLEGLGEVELLEEHRDHDERDVEQEVGREHEELLPGVALVRQPGDRRRVRGEKRGVGRGRARRRRRRRAGGRAQRSRKDRTRHHRGAPRGWDEPRVSTTAKQNCRHDDGPPFSLRALWCVG